MRDLNRLDSQSWQWHGFNYGQYVEAVATSSRRLSAFSTIDHIARFSSKFSNPLTALFYELWVSRAGEYALIKYLL